MGDLDKSIISEVGESSQITEGQRVIETEHVFKKILLSFDAQSPKFSTV